MYKPPKAGPLLYIRSSIYWVVMAIIVVFIASTGLLTFPLPFKTRYAYLSLAPRLCTHALKWICGIDYRVEHFGDGLPSEPTIVIAKHQSTWETFAFTFLFPPQVWVMKKSLMKVPFFGWGIGLLDPIAIDRAAGVQALEQVVEQGRERLERGVWVVIFPEGTRAAVGKAKRFKTGGAVLAERTGYQVLPVAHNAGQFWPKNSFLKYPGTVVVRVGPLIDPKGKTFKEINQEAESWIEQQMTELESV